MNLRQYTELFAAYTSEHFETFQLPTPIPTNHPPGLKNAPKVQMPDEVYKDAQDKGKKKRKHRNKRKPGDLAYVIRKTLNQGHPSMVNHSKGGDPNLWNPSQIADL